MFPATRERWTASVYNNGHSVGTSRLAEIYVSKQRAGHAPNICNRDIEPVTKYR